ncbi:MAG: saccharopine dehydrogenase NADP-binding domain-containing protein [Myxococcota bacterium]|nr:saccharopine dehydrogenase NADP-binding domain-containing protein [Myxococcota bacterium]
MKQSPAAQTLENRPRNYDIIVYGASGFTGRQAAHYLNVHAPKSLKWAIAGRSFDRLNTLFDDLPLEQRPDIIVADAFDESAIDAMCRQTKVVLTTVGPYARFGRLLIDRCVAHRVDYVDITGETPFVRELIDTYHEQAASMGICIIPCSGFDSVPSDLGTYFAVRVLRERGAKQIDRVIAAYTAKGGLNGGTVASGLHLGASGHQDQMDDLFLLNPSMMRPPHESTQEHADPKWPHYDHDLKRWLAPFIMAPINTRVVRRTQALLADTNDDYGPNFHYQEYMECRAPFGALKAISIAVGIRLMDSLFRVRLGRSLIKLLAPAPGQGPSEKTMEEGFFRAKF